MTTYVDSSVLLDLIHPGAAHREWSFEQLSAAKANGPVLVSDIVYSEISTDLDSVDEVDQVIGELALARCGYSNEALFRAAKAFKQYRDHNAGTKVNVLPDFLIGALADADQKPLLTRDPAKVKSYFPEVKLICPD